MSGKGQFIVFNKKTKEVHTENEEMKEFSTYVDARVVRITLNDQTKETDKYGITYRATDWGVAYYTGDFNIQTRPFPKKRSSGVFEVLKITKVYLDGKTEIKEIKNIRAGLSVVAKAANDRRTLNINHKTGIIIRRKSLGETKMTKQA